MDERFALLETELAKGPAANGWEDQRWTLERVRTLIGRQFQVSCRSEGLKLTGWGGLRQQLTKRVLDSALEGEITDRPGYGKHDAEGQGSGNSRNGARPKTVLPDVGPVEARVQRDVAGTFERQLVARANRTCPAAPRSRPAPTR
ncbi:conserved hypothetical protein [Streptomyces griseoflavus Tu4000]|uniref:Mutator family transposase n=1 Tax=Streptomyces griseoflavus Tu4000 TaxID=467200 RepID=D9XKW9_9ACTN|nr:conserved hypothetical protein [Streptomyces griseoflavus Tu4000]